MEPLGRVAEWFGRFLVRVLFSIISFVMALIAAFVVVMIVRVAASLITGQQLGIDFIHPVFAPFWMAVGMWTMHGSEKR